MNQQMEFDQTSTDLLLGFEKEVIRFCWPLSHFQYQIGTLNSNFDTKKLKLFLEPMAGVLTN